MLFFHIIFVDFMTVLYTPGVVICAGMSASYTSSSHRQPKACQGNAQVGCGGGWGWMGVSPCRPVNKGFSRPCHLQGKECNYWLVGQAHGFPLFDPM